MDDKFKESLKKQLMSKQRLDINIVMKGQYFKAYELLKRAIGARLTPIIVGPPGIGKSLLVRKFAADTNQKFYEVFFDELMRPPYLIGSYDPSMVLRKGYCLDSLEPGPLLRAMVEGGIFVAQELNRATEFCQNSLLEPLEERSYYIPRIGRVRAHENFAFIAVSNPMEMAGIHSLSEALRDRLRVWIDLDYPEKEVEIEIIKINNPEYAIDTDTLEKVYQIVAATRKNPSIEQPASVRSGISIARLIERHLAMEGELSTEIIADYAYHVLIGGVKVKQLSDQNPNDIVRQIIQETIG